MASQSCLTSSSTQAGPCPNATAPRPLIRVSSPYNAFDGRYTDEDRSNRRKKPHHHCHTLMFSFLNHSPMTTLDSDSDADAPRFFDFWKTPVDVPSVLVETTSLLLLPFCLSFNQHKQRRAMPASSLPCRLEQIRWTLLRIGCLSGPVIWRGVRDVRVRCHMICGRDMRHRVRRMLLTITTTNVHCPRLMHDI